MKRSNYPTGVQTCRLQAVLSSATIHSSRFASKRRGLIAAALLLFLPNPDAAAAAPNDQESAWIARRLAEMIRQAGARPEAKPAGKAAAAENGAVRRLMEQAGEDVQVRFRPGNQTVLQLSGKALAPAPRGVARLALAESHEQTARKLFAAHRDLMRLVDPDNELTLVQNERDSLGRRRLRLTQAYKGLPVWPAELSVHFDEQGNLSLVEGAYVPTPELTSLDPTLTAAGAIARAKADLDPNHDASASVPELIIHGPVNAPSRLAWKLELTVSIAEAWLFVVDAQNGNILHRSSLVFDAHVTGSGVDLFGQTRTLNVWQRGDTFYMIDTSKPSFNPAFDPIDNPHGVILIADARGAGVNEVLQNGAHIVTSSFPNLWDVPASVSAAFNFSQTYDYFLERHGRNSIDGQGGNITAIVQVGNYNNASWHGSLGVMLFGDAEPYAASLDAIGHELTHGVTQMSAGLVYESQPGALNEAFSDIFAEMVEARTRGENDWVIGSELNNPLRNMKAPGTMHSRTIGRPYPSKMSEFAQLPSDIDNGGVHVNSSIINHAFYLLAEGLPGAVGRRSAELIFFRALTQHLLPQSQFIDCRLACIASAEELFGKGSTEARMTAQAFDGVEIFGAPGTPEPEPIPVVSGPDSTLFVYYDFWSGEYVLGRREVAQEDGEYGSVLAAGVSLGRPAVTGDGNIALFVSTDHDICVIGTADADTRQCLGLPGRAHSVAISPDATLAAFVLRNTETGAPEGAITVLDLANDTAETYNLVAPSTDGVSVDAVLFADSMTFTTDSTTLIYDALSELKFGNGPTVRRWSVFSLNLKTGITSIVVPPQDGIDTGNPSLGRAGNRYLAYDARESDTGDSFIVVLDMFTGNSSVVGTVEGGWGYPSFLGDESGVIYSAADPDAILTGFSLVKQDLTPDRLQPKGDPTLWYEDANLGVVYRRGPFQGTNALPTVTLELSADRISTGGSVTLTATAEDPDGTVVLVEFYDGSDLLGESLAAPHTFEWENVPAGNHLLIARAYDDLGGVSDSSPRLLTVTGGGTTPNTPPTVSLALSADHIPEQGSVTLTAAAEDPDGSIARVEFYRGPTLLGQSDAPPYVFVWENVPAGNHLLMARAIDNTGASTDSSPRFLTVSGGSSPGDEKPGLSIVPLAGGAVRLIVSGQPGDYIIQMSEDLKEWSDIYPVAVDASGTGSVEDSGGPLHFSRLFYRARRE